MDTATILNQISISGSESRFRGEGTATDFNNEAKVTLHEVVSYNQERKDKN
ncbi:hypothetical protein S7335_1661 [Synechococcus sp. PCC 7335]|nr:hypothetical protein S7335_1661 [Synechococcus sp. PCC 7335]